MTQVIFCTDGVFPFTVGGMQRHSRLLIEELAKNDEVEILVVHPHPIKVFNNARINEVTLDGINIKNNYLLECYKYSKRIYGVLVGYPNAIIYSQGLSVWYGISKLKSRLIINPHGLEPFQALGFKSNLEAIPFKVVFKYIFRNSTYVVSLGGKLTDILKRNTPKSVNIVEINNAVNIPTSEPLVRNFTDKVQVLFLARFAQNKGIDILFSAIEILNKMGFAENYHYTLGGMGPLFNYYKKKNKFKNVTLLGFVDDNKIPSIFQSSELFVLPTLFEGMPTVVLEAMSYGLPVIVSDVGATDIMINNSNGRIIQPGSVDSLIEALIWYHSLDQIERKQLSINAFSKVIDNFTWEIVAKKHFELFKLFNTIESEN